MKEHQYMTEALAEMKQLAAKAENHRRERASMPTTPMPGVVDYASAGVALDNGWQHMNESIVHGQRQRTEAAAELVTLGLYHTLRWLAATGYKVPTLLWHWNEPHEIASGNLDALQQEPVEDLLKDPNWLQHNAAAGKITEVRVNGELLGRLEGGLELPVKAEVIGDIRVDAVSEEAAKKVWQELRDLLEDLKTQGYVTNFSTDYVMLPEEPAEELTVDNWNAAVLSAMDRAGEVPVKPVLNKDGTPKTTPQPSPSENEIAAYSAVNGISFSTSAENPAHVVLVHSESGLRVACDAHPTAEENFRHARDSLLNALESWKRLPEAYDPLKDPTADGYTKVEPEPPVKRADVTVDYIIPETSLSVRSHSGVKLTHNPTGLWVESSKSRSAHANVAEGFRMLEKLLANPAMASVARIAKLCSRASMSSGSVRTFTCNVPNPPTASGWGGS